MMIALINEPRASMMQSSLMRVMSHTNAILPVTVKKTNALWNTERMAIADAFSAAVSLSMPSARFSL